MSLARIVAQRPLPVLVGITVVTLVALLPASRVRFVTELQALLPAGSPAAEDYRIFLDHFGGFEKVFVLLQVDSDGGAGPPSQEQREAVLVEAATLLAEEMARSPEVAAARSGVSAEDEQFFFETVVPRAPLLMGSDWLQQVRRRIEPQAIAERAADLRASLLSPSGAFTGSLLRSDPLGFCQELSWSRTISSAVPLDPLTLTFLSPQGDTSLVILTPARAEIDPEGGRKLQQELQAAIGRLQQDLQVPLLWHALGGPLYAAQDEAILRQDLSRTVTGSMIGCAALLVAAFEGLLVPVAALCVLGVALIWTAALIGVSLHQISAIGIGFAAVLVGLGIDYCIHGGARFRQAVLDRGDREHALASVFTHSGPGILTSALTTAAAFAVLGFAHLRPLRELGLVVATGILSILVASATAGAAVMMLWPQGTGRPARTGLLWRLMGRLVELSNRLAGRRPGAVLIVTLLVTAASLAGLSRLTIDPDLRALRPADHPALTAERLLVDRFSLGLDTVTVLVPGNSIDDALSRATVVDELLVRQLGEDSDITSPARWLVSEQLLRGRRAALAALPLEQAAAELEQQLRIAGLNPAAFGTGIAALRALAQGRDPGALHPGRWPEWLSELVRESDDGAWVALRLRLPPETWPQGPPRELVARIKAQAPGAAVASAVAVGEELRLLASRDVARLSLLALAVVALVVLVSFRGKAMPSLLAGTPVVLGSIWVLGLWAGVGRSIDLMSLAVLPIMLGIGIDDGLHALHGARRDTSASGISGAVLGAGRAMVLTSLTTSVGFGSLLLSRVPGLRSGGLLVAIGVLACLAATLLVLPACEALWRSRVRRTRARRNDPRGP